MVNSSVQTFWEINSQKCFFEVKSFQRLSQKSTELTFLTEQSVKKYQKTGLSNITPYLQNFHKHGA